MKTADVRVDAVLEHLAWMREERIWPNGLRYLWTDAFGVVLLLSLHERLGGERYLVEARRVVAEVDRVLGRPAGLRIGEEPDRDGQYYHYLAMWLFALQRLSRWVPEAHERAVRIVQAIHPRFVHPGVGVVWKMLEDLSAPYPGYGLGGLDPYHGLVVYRLLDDPRLEREVAEMAALVEADYRRLQVTQDLGLGMILWMAHFHPTEPWAATLVPRALATLERMWVDPPGYFCREPGLTDVRFAFTNYGVSVGLQAVGAMPARVEALQRCFETYRSGDEYDRSAITHVMGCCARLPGLLLREGSG